MSKSDRLKDRLDELFSQTPTPLTPQLDHGAGSSHQPDEFAEKRAIQLATVARVSTSIASILDQTELLQSVVDQTKDNFNLYHAHIYLANETGDYLVLAAGAYDVGRKMVAQGWRIPINHEHSLVARAAREMHGVIVNDIRNEPDFLPNELLPQTLSEMAVPLITGDLVLGVLDVQSDRIGHFTEDDVSIFTTLALQVAVALQNARQYQRAERRSKELAILNELSRSLTSAIATGDVLQMVYQFTKQLMDTSNFYIALYDQKTGMISFPILFLNGETMVVEDRPLSNGLTDYIIQNKTPLLFTDHVLEKMHAIGIDVMLMGDDRPAQSWLGVPMIYGDEVMGVISVQSVDTPGAYKAHELELLKAVALQASNAFAFARQFQDTQKALENSKKLSMENERMAQRERKLREISSRVRGSMDIDVILRTAARELSEALGRKTVIRLGSRIDGDS